MRRLRRRLGGIGLRWRLAGWVALVTLLCTGIAFAAVYHGTGTQLRKQIDDEISGYASGLTHALSQARADTPEHAADLCRTLIGKRQGDIDAFLVRQ